MTYSYVHTITRNRKAQEQQDACSGSGAGASQREEARGAPTGGDGVDEDEGDTEADGKADGDRDKPRSTWMLLSWSGLDYFSRDGMRNVRGYSPTAMYWRVYVHHSLVFLRCFCRCSFVTTTVIAARL